MKLLLQRTLADYVEGPFWLESAVLDDKLHAYLRLTEEPYSYFEGRFAPNGDVFWISDIDGIPKAYQGDKVLSQKDQGDKVLSQKDTFKIAFEANGNLVTLECDNAEAPYELVHCGPTLKLDSSLTHLARIPETDVWVVTTLEQLYKGPLSALKSQGETGIRSFSVDPTGGLWHTSRCRLYRDQQVMFQAEGQLDWPLWTPKGVLITEYTEKQSRLLVIQDGRKTVLWEGKGEWVRATSFR
jgi:hypothetical protein